MEKADVQRFNNQWPEGKVFWHSPPLPSYLADYSGIVPLHVTLHPKVGTEVALFIIDRTPFAREIARLNPFRLHLDTGLMPCPSGPVLFCLFWLENSTGSEPFAMFDNTLNPHDPQQIQIYWDLARQTHWHVFVLGPENEELNWFEFSNDYELDVTFQRVGEVLPRFPCRSFYAAKREFEARYSLEDLFRFANK